MITPVETKEEEKTEDVNERTNKRELKEKFKWPKFKLISETNFKEKILEPQTRNVLSIEKFSDLDIDEWIKAGLEKY